MKNDQNFDAAFASFWQSLMKRYEAGENVSYYTDSRNERRQLESINDKELRLREMTTHGTRLQRPKPLLDGELSTGNKYDWKYEELHETFARLYNRVKELREWDSRNISKVSKEFSARGYAEYGRGIFNEFLVSIGAPPLIEPTS